MAMAVSMSFVSSISQIYSMGNTPSSRYTNALAVASLTPIIFFKNLSYNDKLLYVFVADLGLRIGISFLANSNYNPTNPSN